MRKPLVTYLVSGDASISPTERILQRSGRRVRWDTQVDLEAAIAMKANRRYVVVAHGNEDGTVMWFRSDRRRAARWLWVSMSKPPKRARIYLYSCNAGKKLPHFLKRCDCFGHINVVPMPEAHANDVVLAYLEVVHRLMEDPGYNSDFWRARLGRYINEAIVRETSSPTSLTGAHKLHMLRKSLGNVDD